jgi:biopolymer transport protein ExbD
MNPMVDMAFLLVSFFMMTTTFKAEIPEEVHIPASTSEIKLPDKAICTITLSAGGRVYFGLDSKYDRARLLSTISQQYGIEFSESQSRTFSLLTAFGVPLNQLQEMLEAKTQQEPYPQEGIPFGDSSELRMWLLQARMINPRLRFAINADADARWPEVHQVFETLRDLNITRFNIVTDRKILDAPED